MNESLEALKKLEQSCYTVDPVLHNLIEKELKSSEIMKQMFNDNTNLVKDSRLGYIAEIHPKVFRFHDKKDFDLAREALNNGRIK